MESLYHSTNRSLSEAHQGYLRCEQSAGGANSEQFQHHFKELQRRLDQILRYWVICSTPNGLSPNGFSPDSLSPIDHCS